MAHHHRTDPDPQLRQWFDHVDADRSGFIDAMELQQAMKMGGVDVDLKLTRKIILLCDEDGNGLIDFNEYQKLHLFLTRVQQSFSRFDADHSRSLDRGEAYSAVRHAGFNIERATFDGIFNLFDADGNKTLSYTEFIAMSVVLESSWDAYKENAGPQTGGTFDAVLVDATGHALRTKASFVTSTRAATAARSANPSSNPAYPQPLAPGGGGHGHGHAPAYPAVPPPPAAPVQGYGNHHPQQQQQQQGYPAQGGNGGSRGAFYPSQQQQQQGGGYYSNNNGSDASGYPAKPHDKNYANPHYPQQQQYDVHASSAMGVPVGGGGGNGGYHHNPHDPYAPNPNANAGYHSQAIMAAPPPPAGYPGTSSYGGGGGYGGGSGSGGGGGGGGMSSLMSGGMSAASQFAAMKKKKKMPVKGMLAGLVGVGLLAAVLD